MGFYPISFKLAKIQR